MTDRIGALGGELWVASTPGQGTTVTGSIALMNGTRTPHRPNRRPS